MKKINFNFKITDLSGNELPYNTQENVANVIASSSSQSPVKMYEIARKIFNDGEIELTSDDLTLVKNAIEKNTIMTDLVKAQILNVINQ